MRANYIRNFVKATKSWFKHNENEVNVQIKISKRNRVQKYKKEQPPTPDELKRILDAADVRRRRTAQRRELHLRTFSYNIGIANLTTIRQENR